MSYNTLGIARRTWRFKGAEGAAAKRVVVVGDAENECKNTATANAGRLLGVTFDSAADREGVALSQYALPEIETAGAVAYGDPVNVAGDGGNPALRGRVKVVNEAAGTVINLVGIAQEPATAAGQRIKVDIRRFGHTYTA